MTLQVRDLGFAYGDRPVLRGANLTIPSGESGFLLGPSGCGKSTLLRCIAGLEDTYTGTVRLDGEPLEGVPTHKRGVGMLMQEPALFPHLDVGQNVAFGLRYRGVPRPERTPQVERYLGLVGLTDRVDDSVDDLSGGQRQRVALARTLAARPRVVLLDEPLSALDRALREELGPRLKGLLRDQDVVALWVTHDEEEAHAWGDKVWRMEHGALSRTM